MKILLMQPAYKDTVSDRVFQPLGLGYIAAALRQDGFSEVMIYDGFLSKVKNKFSLEQINDEVRGLVEGFNPDVVGINNPYQVYSDDAIDLASLVKNIKDVPVITGGTHATVCYKEVLESDAVDVIVVGEGETTICELVETLYENEDLSGVKGIAFKRNGKIILNEKRGLIKDLDSIPFPARDLLPMKDYFRLESRVWNMRLPKISMISSRGCVGQCFFCSAHQVWGCRIFRSRSSKNVVDEIEYVVKKYGAREIDFEDDQMATDPKRLEGICQEIIDRGLDIKWKTPAGIGHWTLNTKLLRLMKKSGYYRATFGIESASPRIRKFIRKTYDIKQASKVISEAHDIGLWINGTFIIGFPNETKEEIMQTVNWFLKSDMDYGNFYLPVPNPGTPMYDFFVDGGYEINPWIMRDDLNLGYQTDHFSKEELSELVKGIRSRVMRRIAARFINPFVLAKKINSFEDLMYCLKLVRYYLGFLLRGRKFQGN